MMEIPSRVFLWSDKLLYLGSPVDAEPHRHHVTEICLALEGTLSAETADGSAVHRARGVVLAPHVRHRVRVESGHSAMILVGPLTRAGSALGRTLAGRQVAELAPAIVEDAEASLLTLPGEPCLDPAEGHCDALLARLASPWGPQRVHREVEQAISLVYGTLDQSLPTGEFARATGLGERQFGRLFRKQVGMALRQYRRWIRLRLALTLAFAGESLTTAAHEAGFADSAHFTRTCRRAFGLPPSRLPCLDQFAEHPAARQPVSDSIQQRSSVATEWEGSVRSCDRVPWAS